MATPDTSMTGTWVGTHSSGLSTTTIDLRFENDAFSGKWYVDGHEQGRAVRAMEFPIVNPEFNGTSVIFNPINNGTARMEIKFTGQDEVVFGPVLDPNKFDLNDPRILNSIESHRVKLFRQNGNNEQNPQSAV